MNALDLFHSYGWHAPCYAFYVLHRFAGLGFRLRSSPEQPCKTRWGVVQLVGHLTVNEDGEGSNPSAPANFPLESLRNWRRSDLIPMRITDSKIKGQMFPAKF